MERKNWPLALALLVALGCLVAPAQISAQETCHDWVDCQGDGHSLDGHENFDRKGYHTSCDYCVIGPCHDTCFHEEEERVAYTQALEAATALDGGAIVEVATASPHFFHLNEERQALQLLNCSGTALIASVPLNEFQFEAVLAVSNRMVAHVADPDH